VIVTCQLATPLTDSCTIESIGLAVANSEKQTVNERTNSQRRFTVVELPVLPIVVQSLVMPFKYLPELVKYGGIPFLLTVAANGISFILAREDASNSATGGLMMVAHFVLFTPFSVTWTKLAIYSRSAIATDAPLRYSRTQWIYLLATAVMTISLAIIVGPWAVLLRYGQRNFDNQAIVAAGTLLLAGLILFAVVFVRLAFVFPAIAIRKYAGIGAAWKQTKGNIEQLAAIIVLSYAPYYVVRQILDWSIGYHPPGLAAAAKGCLEMMLVAMATTALAGPALAYKTIVLDEPEDAPALCASTPGRG